MDNIRNFCIIAHIDHGKSTLADRMLELTGTVAKRQMQAQYLDKMDLERERGITIKMAPVRMRYQDYTLNLIDTPGHSDFGYEVSRALNAVEGAVLLVDATQGVQAQTLFNFHAARRAGLKIIGAINKVDLKPEGIDDLIVKVASLIGCEPEAIHKVSGKTGAGVPELLDDIIASVPAPAKPEKNVLQALVFDSLYDDHKGDIAFVRVVDGSVTSTDTIQLLATGFSSKVKEVGIFSPELKSTSELSAGAIGYVATGLKDPAALTIGDTLTLKGEKPAPLPGYQEPKPVVFVSFYPSDASEHDELGYALARLRLSDSALTFEPDRSEVLGRGYKCGFLGRLHFEIVAERLAREFNLEVVNSFPSVAYRVVTRGEEKMIYNPKDFPADYDQAFQPIVALEIITPASFLSQVLSLGQIFHWSDLTTENMDDSIILKLKMPLADLIRDFDDKLKSATEGYASMSYELLGDEPGDIAKLEILVAGEPITGLTRVVAKDELVSEGRVMLKKLKDLLPRQQFAQALQAKALGQIIAREDIPALRKDVTGYLYGGDRTRKMKLWKKQERGKKRLKERAHVNVPPEVFKELLKK